MSPFVPENIETVCLEIIKPKTQPILITKRLSSSKL